VGNTTTNQNYKHEETEGKLQFGNTWYYSIQNVFGALKLEAT